jgi:hypothetical protein
MDVRETAREPEGSWASAGQDILPANILTGPASAVSPPPARRRRHGRAIAGVLAVGLAGLVLGVILGLRVGMPLVVGRGGAVHTLTTVNGDPLVNARVVGEPPIPQAPIAYLEAQAKGNGQAMWALYSPQAQQLLTKEGGGPQQLTQILRAHPLPAIKQITFAGGVLLNDGREATVFVVTANVNGALTQVPYYFTVNANGQIDEAH